MVLTAAALQRAGVHITPTELDRLVSQAVMEMVPARIARDLRKEMTPPEVEALESGGFCLEPLEDAGPDDPVAQATAVYAALLATSLSVTEVARLLGVATSRIRQQLAAHTLYGIKEPGGWRLPRFQFDDEGRQLLPGIRQVLPRLDPHLHPVGVYTWFTTPNADLVADDGETPLSPRDWLRSGGSPAPVAEMAGSLGIIP